MRRSRLRGWLLPLLAAMGAGVLVAWGTSEPAPIPLQQFQTDRYVTALLSDGQSLLLVGSRHWKTRFAEYHLASGHITEWPGRDVSEDHSVNARTPRTIWAKPVHRPWLDKNGIGPWYQGPFVPYDVATGKRLAEVRLPKDVRHYQEVHWGDLFITAWKETWLAPCIRFRVFDPRSNKVLVDRLMPAAADLYRVVGVQPSPDSRHVALGLFCRHRLPPFQIHLDTLVVDATSGLPLSLLPGFFNPTHLWSADSKELIGTGLRQKEVWLERWDWKSATKLTSLFLEPLPAIPGKRGPVIHRVLGWLPSSHEWLIEENRIGWQDTFPKLSRWLRDRHLISPEPPGGWSSLQALNQNTGKTRTVAARIEPSSDELTPLVMPDGQGVVVREPQAEARQSYALYPLTGSYPWPWPWRLAAMGAAALLAFIALRWLLATKSGGREPAEGVVSALRVSSGG